MQDQPNQFQLTKAAFQHAAMLSFLLPGAGQLYQGRPYRGFLFFALFIACFAWTPALFGVAVVIAFAAALECFRGPKLADAGKLSRRFLFYLAVSFLAFLAWFFSVGGAWLFVRPAAAESTGGPQVDLVDLRKIDFTIHVDMVFAGTNNIAGKKLLPENRCVVRLPVAKALSRVQQNLKLRGFSLKALDCYRPLSLETKFLEWMPKPHAAVFSAENNPFYRGAAVDMFIVQSDGQPVSLPAEYEWVPKVQHKRGRAFTAATLRKAKSNLKTLTGAMKSEGFLPDAHAWWRFRYNSWEQFQPSDLPFSEIP